VRFARPDQWLGGVEPVDVDDAMRRAARRYLAAYGPATRETFARWFGITSPARAGRWLAGLDDELATVSVEGSEALVLAADVEELSRAEPEGAVRLLPAFDHYVVAAPRGAEAVLPVALRARVYRPQGWLSPVVFVDGRVVGVWSHERSGEGVSVEIEPFSPLPASVRRAAESEALSLADFVDARLTNVNFAG
jgi:hypothetical protein